MIQLEIFRMTYFLSIQRVNLFSQQFHIIIIKCNISIFMFYSMSLYIISCGEMRRRAFLIKKVKDERDGFY